MKSLSLFLVVTTMFSLSTAVFADELLDILESKKTESIVQEKSILTKKIKQELGQVTAEQNIFFNFLDSNEYEKALFQWNSAFEDSEFRKTPTGLALYSYLLFKNNLPINAVEKLFSIKSPEKINSELKRIFTSMIPGNHDVWKYAQIKWQNGWTPIFGVNAEVRVLSRQEFSLQNKDYILELLKKTKINTYERSWLEWQMSLSLALEGQVARSAKVLAHLQTEKNRQVSDELIQITAARLLYQQGYLDAAIRYYEKINKKSDYWFVAQEEAAWAYIRKGEPQNTLAKAKTLSISEFAPHVGPELVFLQTLSFLKVCDYPNVAKGIQEFRKRFQERSKKLLALEKIGNTPEANQLVTILKKGRTSLLNLGSAAFSLPRYVSLDEVLFDLIQTQVHLEKEAEIAGELYARTLSGGTARVGFDASVENLKKQIVQRAEIAHKASLSLLQRRASEELKEIHDILQKMHIVEAELIQQISVAERVVKATSKRLNMAKAKNKKEIQDYSLKFPFVGETWFDELSNYQIDIKKGCQAKKAEL